MLFFIFFFKRGGYFIVSSVRLFLFYFLFLQRYLYYSLCQIFLLPSRNLDQNCSINSIYICPIFITKSDPARLDQHLRISTAREQRMEDNAGYSGGGGGEEAICRLGKHMYSTLVEYIRSELVGNLKRSEIVACMNSCSLPGIYSKVCLHNLISVVSNSVQNPISITKSTECTGNNMQSIVMLYMEVTQLRLAWASDRW